ncbi:MAG: ABC transporter substrate-binding protein [Peptostreptococcaceae bacterium]
MKKRLLALFLTSIIFVGCNEVEDTKDDTIEDISIETQSMNLKYINLSMVKANTINPIENTKESVGHILSLVYDGLFTIDEGYNVVPQLVSEYNIHSDGLVMDITLEDAMWHNGEKVTSRDVQYTVNLIKSMVESPYNVFTSNIDSINVIDDKNLKINFKEKYAFNIDNLIFPILCEADVLNPDEAIGNGKYKIENYKSRKGMFLRVNKEYYDASEVAKKDIVVSVVPEPSALSSMLLALKSDISSVYLNDLSSFYEDEFEIKKFEGRDFETVIFNYDNPFFRDINFRQALISSIDRDSILDEAYMSDARIINFPLNSTSKYYDESISTIEFDTQKAKEFIEEIDLKIINSDVEITESPNLFGEDIILDNIERVDLDNQDEIEETEDTRLSLNNLNLKILVNRENGERVKTAHIIRTGLRDIGINAIVYEKEGIELDIALQNKDYDLALIGWELSSIPDISNIIQSIGYTDQKLQGYLSSLKIASSESQIKDIYMATQNYLNSNALYIPLVIRDDYLVYTSRLKGQINPNSFDIYEGISNLDI